MISFQPIVLTWSVCAIIVGVLSVQGATLRGSSVSNNIIERNHHHRHLDEAICENTKTGKFKVKEHRIARSCGGFANNNLCENELNDGSGNKIFEVCAKSCNACGTAPTSAPTPFNDNKVPVCENAKTGKFKVKGDRIVRSCGGFANNNRCENELNDGSGNKVFEVCAKSCNACGTAPTSAPTPFDDNNVPLCENGKTGKFKVKGHRTERSCGGFANNNLCENELNDGSGNKVFEVCAKSCDACGTAPTSAPTQFEDNKVECENEKVGKFKVIGVKGTKACGGFANNGYCNNDIHQNAGGRKVFEACRKSCNACSIVLTNVPTSSPTASPSSAPSTAPSAAPSVAPSAGPSESPSSRPSGSPSASPSSSPSSSPSDSPSSTPSVSPSNSPTAAPTFFPTVTPPTFFPTVTPTATSSVDASSSGSPSDEFGTESPTQSPTATPTATPTSSPLATPTTLAPTTFPTGAPTEDRSFSLSPSPSSSEESSGASTDESS